MGSEPKTLQEALIYFADSNNCRKYLVARRWPDGVTCPRCGSDKVAFLEKYNRWQCNSKTHKDRQFTSKTGTIFEDSPLGLDKWLAAMWLIVNCKNGISSYEVARDLDVSQKSAWHMLHRIRLAMQDDLTGGMLGGEVEVDETFIGGKARNMHADRKKRVMKTGFIDTGNKTIVMGVLERASEGKPKRVRTTILSDRKKATMLPEVAAHVSKDATIYSDEHGEKWNIDGDFQMQVVRHLQKYVDGNVHTNGLENFWSLLKCSLGGTYVSVEPFHLFRYLDEQAFRFNNRKDSEGDSLTDSDRFDLAVRQIVGKRLTWAEVTGKVTDHQAPPAIN
ncbi:MAG TPA: IS1595 family transposase [Bryobacteraceae bacterium]|nr:IS1595 family transposase [Bryobacteraceae bacterium]